MAKTTKPFMLRDDYTHNTYTVNHHPHLGASSYYTLPYASPMGLYTGAQSYYPERTTVKRSSSSTPYQAPQASDRRTILEELERELISAEDNNKVAELLARDFIWRMNGQQYQTVIKSTNNDYELTTHTYTYQNYDVQPMIEVLLLDKETAQAIKKLLENENTKDHKRAQFFAAMQHIQLANNEAIDFSIFNLANASFENARLGQSTFGNTNTTGANFNGCDLTKTDISQEQLDVAATYKDAKLKDGMWVYWDKDIKSGLLARIADMNSYIEVEIPDKTDPKHIKVKELCEKHKALLEGNAPISSLKKQEIINDFVGKETSDILEKYRGLKSRAAEIGALVAGLLTGVGLIAWGIALGVQRYRNGYWGLFYKPKTAALAHKVVRNVPTRVGVH